MVDPENWPGLSRRSGVQHETLHLVGFQLMALGPSALAFRARGFLYFVSLFLRARARAAGKPCAATVSDCFGNRLFEHFPGLFEHFPGYSNIFRVLSTGRTCSIWGLSTIKTPRLMINTGCCTIKTLFCRTCSGLFEH